MILDSSSIVAVILAEPGFEEVLSKIKKAPTIWVGALTLLETVMVLTNRLRRDATPEVRDFLRDMEAEVIAFSERHWEVAFSAYLRYGKGRHPAALNFGDCMSYATAAVAGLPLLYVGEDFTKTDIPAA